MRADFLHPDFVAEPYWWEAYRPASGELADLPRNARVAIVGAGYAGLATALELSRHGVEAVILERGVLGIGASTMSARALRAAPPRSRLSAPIGCCPTPRTRSR